MAKVPAIRTHTRRTCLKLYHVVLHGWRWSVLICVYCIRDNLTWTCLCDQEKTLCCSMVFVLLTFTQFLFPKTRWTPLCNPFIADMVVVGDPVCWGERDNWGRLTIEDWASESQAVQRKYEDIKCFPTQKIIRLHIPAGPLTPMNQGGLL